ncbi:NUDIX hydrolase [Rhizobium sp.]|uniref:NUDIX hydrolase n=1 Tax=Rhizobium sp. TaxID=391 RepID=UPI003917B8FD
MKKWDLAGGHVEKGEGLDVTLVRECQEEVGLTPRAFDHVATLYEDDDPEKKSRFDIFRVRIWDGGTPRQLGDEHSEFRWFTIDDFLSLLSIRGPALHEREMRRAVDTENRRSARKAFQPDAHPTSMVLSPLPPRFQRIVLR